MSESKNPPTVASVQEALENLDTTELIGLWNDYCSGDDYVYENSGEDFFKEHFADDPYGAVCSVLCGHYYSSDDWVCFNGYANLDSFNSPTDQYSPIDLEWLAEELMSDYSHDELNDILEPDEEWTDPDPEEEEDEDDEES